MSAEILEIGILNSNSLSSLSHRQQQHHHHHGNTGIGTNSSSSPQRRLMCFFILFMISIFYFMVYGFAALSPWDKFDRQVIRSSSSSSNTELQLPIVSSSSTESRGGAAANNKEGLPTSEKHFGRKTLLTSSSSSSLSLSRGGVVSLEEILDNFTSLKCSSSSNHHHHQLFLNRDLAFTSPQFHQWLPHPNPIYQNSPEYHTLKKRMEEEEENGDEKDRENHNNNNNNIIRNNEMINTRASTKKDEAKTTRTTTSDDDIVVPPEFYAPVIDWKKKTTKRKTDSPLDEKEEIRKFLLKNIVDDTDQESSTNRENCKVLFNQLVDHLVDDLLSKFQKRRMNFEKSQREQFHRARKGDSPPSTTYWHQESRKELWQCLWNKNRNININKNTDDDKKHHQHDQLDDEDEKSDDNDEQDDEFRFLFIGNSNTRTLMTNIQARLEGNTRQMSRVKAKQLCDNRAHNHSCFVKVVANKEDFFVANKVSKEEDHHRQKTQRRRRGRGKFTIHLDYIGYTEDWYHPSLKTRIDTVYEPRSHRRPGGGANEHRRSARLPVDVVVMNTGINTIQTNANWMGGNNNNNKHRQRKMVDLRNWLEKQWGIIDSSSSSSSSSNDKNNKNNKKSHHHHRSNQKSNPPQHLLHFFWHSTTPLCPNMPHFRRYRFRKSKWSGQSAETVSEGTRLMNDQIKNGLPWGTKSKPDGGGGYFLSYIESSPASLTTRNRNRRSSIDDDIKAADGNGLLDGVQRDDRTKILVAAGSGSRMTKNTNNLTLSSSSPYYPASMFGKSIPTNHNNNKPSASSLPPKYCYYYEDPLHHRFLDRVIVDVMLSQLGC